MSRLTDHFGPPFGDTHFGERPPRPLPRFSVVLANDPAVALMFVVRTVMDLTRLCRAEAIHKMWEAHHVGRSQVLVTHQERAELYVEQFAERGLKATIEPAN